MDVDFSLARLRSGTHVKTMIFRVVKFFPKDGRAPVCIDVQEKQKTLPSTVLWLNLQLRVVELVAELGIVYDWEEAGADWEGEICHFRSDQQSVEGTKWDKGRCHFLRVNQQVVGMVDGVCILTWGSFDKINLFSKHIKTENSINQEPQTHLEEFLQLFPIQRNFRCYDTLQHPL